MKLILDYINDPSKSESEGWQLLLALGLMLLSRLAFFTMNFNVGLQTAIRLSGATQYIGFSKLLRLSNPSDKALGQLVTCCTSDQERIAEAVIISVLFFGKSCQKMMHSKIYINVLCLFRDSNHVCLVHYLFLDVSGTNVFVRPVNSAFAISNNGEHLICRF